MKCRIGWVGGGGEEFPSTQKKQKIIKNEMMQVESSRKVWD